MVKSVATLPEFEAILKANSTVIVDFTATWCGPCKRIGPVFEALASSYPSVTFIKVDVDDNSDTSEKCGVSCMPTFQLYKNGEKKETLEGADEAGLRAILDKHK